MFKVYKKEIEVAGKKISLETGKVARQADGAIIATSGETVILATEALPALMANDIPADGVAISYALYILRQGLQGEVGSGKRNERKERLICMMILMLLEHLDRMIRHGGRCIKPFLGRMRLVILKKLPRVKEVIRINIQ